MECKSVSAWLLAGLATLALLPAPALADPPPWAPAHGYRAKEHRYVYYPAYEVYYAPETRLWFWFGGGQWQTGVSLPFGMAAGGMPGVSVLLDTRRPYERHEYVIQRYGRYGEGQHRERGRDDDHDRRHDRGDDNRHDRERHGHGHGHD